MYSVGSVRSLRILANFFTMILIEVTILYFPVILICLNGRFLLKLHISVVFDGFFFLVVLTKVFIAQHLTLYTINKVD